MPGKKQQIVPVMMDNPIDHRPWVDAYLIPIKARRGQ